MKPKQNKAQRIVELERKLQEALAGQAYVYHFAHRALDKTGTKQFLGSGLVLTLTALGGKEIFEPVLIRDGLSEATIAALKADLVRSYEGAVAFKP